MQGGTFSAVAVGEYEARRIRVGASPVVRSFACGIGVASIVACGAAGVQLSLAGYELAITPVIAFLTLLLFGVIGLQISTIALGDVPLAAEIVM